MFLLRFSCFVFVFFTVSTFSGITNTMSVAKTVPHTNVSFALLANTVHTRVLLQAIRNHNVFSGFSNFSLSLCILTSSLDDLAEVTGQRYSWGITVVILSRLFG